MIWHPLTWSFWMVTAAGTLLYLLAASRAVDVTLNWSPASADKAQLRREQRAESATLLGRGALMCLTTATLVGLVGICLIWHNVVSGAMCGTGVMQAMGTDGVRASIFWTAALLVLYSWWTLDRIGGDHPQGVLTRTSLRVLITAAPFLALGLFYAWQALMRIDTIPAVSCCAAVYDRVLDGTASLSSRWIANFSLWGNLAGTLVLLLLVAATIRKPDNRSAGALFALAVIWTPMSVVAVKTTWAAYYYQVLSHPCPWCLFLPAYGGVGFLIFGCLTVAVLESLTVGLTRYVRLRHPALTASANRFSKRAALRIAIALIGFSLLTVGPAVTWRLRTGVWLHGSP